MKNIIIILLLINTTLYSQNHEVNFNTRIGTATGNFSVLTPTLGTRYAFKKMRNLNDKGVYFNYKYKLFKKINLYISTGFDLSQSKYYQKILDGRPKHLDNIIINKTRLTYHIFGLNQQFNFYGGKLILDLGINWIERIYSNKIDNYKTAYKSNNEDWIKYKYDLTTYYDRLYINESNIRGNDMTFNLEYNVHIKAKIYKNTYLNFGFNYTRNNIFFYDYTVDVLYFHNGSTTPTAFWFDQGFGDKTKNGIRDHFLYFNFGISYKFEKFNIKNKKP